MPFENLNHSLQGSFPSVHGYVVDTRVEPSFHKLSAKPDRGGTHPLDKPVSKTVRIASGPVAADDIKIHVIGSTLQKLRIAQSMANVDFATASMHLNTVYAMYGTDPRADQFFDRRFLADGPPDDDSEWVRDLARKCWRHLHVRVDEWQEFVSHLPIVA